MVRLREWKLEILFLYTTIVFRNGEAVSFYNLKKLIDRKPIEIEHNPFMPQLEKKNEGEDMHDDTPDFRIEEDAWYAHSPKFYIEENRPYRISPHYKQIYNWNYYSPRDNAWNLGCYCTTVYRRLTPLAGCAILTPRHLLTTATSTKLILDNYKKRKHLEGILGVWYDITADLFNSSMYSTPARIHFHSKYIPPGEVNHTHPLPFSFDLAVWAMTTRFKGTALPAAIVSKVVICSRGGPHWWEYLSSTPRYWDLAILVGFQFVKAFKKRPTPWHKYAIRTRTHLVPCPKVEWGWFHCVPGSFWAKYGMDSGAAWHRAMEGRYWLYDGIIGMNAFSLRLRSTEIVHYFTVINSHPVIDFLYDAYMAYYPHVYLDFRFQDTKAGAPEPYRWAWISFESARGVDNYHKKNIPWY